MFDVIGHVTLYDGNGNCGHDYYFQDAIDAENVERINWNATHPTQQIPLVKLKSVSIWIAR